MLRIDLSRPRIGVEEIAAVNRVLGTGQIAQGPEVAAFEEEFSKDAVSGINCVAVNSGTSALHLALLALGVGAGDEVIVPAFTFVATANAVALTGAIPVFVDIDPVTYTLQPGAVASAIGTRTVGIVPVHLYGHPAPMDELMKVAAQHGLFVLEDAAQAHLAQYRGMPVGTIGQAGAFSFYPTKNMTSIEGGMVTTRDPNLARKVRLLRNQGMLRQYSYETVGLNNRMSDVHAAVGRVQLREIANWNSQRRANARYYDSHLSGDIGPAASSDVVHVYHQYTVRVPDGQRDNIRRGLARSGIAAGVYYDTPVHKVPMYRSEADLGETERACDEVLSIPVHPWLTKGELSYVVDTLNHLIREQSG
ncbi:MAG TPA: DegT/DnrJ/EryC1/StrS family aminotransferase [Acidimicrobiales bacterium]|nr:DegT/DnrJ/EryC1/StrS family aminotransferase [Acidimicrobiales bacterium]